MPSEPDLDWALDHAPPPGGLADLQARLDAPRRLRWWWGVLPLAGAVAALLLLVLLAPSPVQVPEAWLSDPSLLALDGGTLSGVRAVPGGDDHLVLAQVEVPQDGVVMARVATARVRAPDPNP